MVYSPDKIDIALGPDAKLLWEISDFQHFFLARGELPFADAKPIADPSYYKSRVMEAPTQYRGTLAVKAAILPQEGGNTSSDIRVEKDEIDTSDLFPPTPIGKAGVEVCLPHPSQIVHSSV